MHFRREASLAGVAQPFEKALAGRNTMKRRTSFTPIAGLLAFFGVVLIAGGGNSYASDVDDVKAVVTAYHAALSALDPAKMEALWVHDNSVMDIEPSAKSISLGREAVKKSFETTFNALSELKVTQADGPHIQVKGDVAWSTGIANASLKTKAGDVVASSPTYESDVFEKRDGRWLLVSHTALRVPQ
jgi:uncharacterized protein (TIGR02246 family)